MCIRDRCQFNDCAHATEPNCAIKEAEEKEVIDPYRVERYLALQKELEEQKNR